MSKLGVYVCYCSWASSQSTACPPRSPFLANKMVSSAVLYLKAWMLVLGKYLDTGMSAEHWMGQLMDSDGSIYREVASCLEAELRAVAVSNTEKMEDDRDERNLKMLRTQIDHVTSKLHQEECSSDEDMGVGSDAPRVIFVFDEARGLLSGDDISQSPFYNIQRALRVFFDFSCFFALALDTDAKMSELLPVDDHSARARPFGTKRLPPIYYLPNVTLHLPKPGQKFEDYVDPSSWLKYGRPMWAARMSEEPTPLERRCRSVVALAGLKLLGKLCGDFQAKDVNILSGKMTESQAMALLAAAAGLEICPRSVLAQTMTAWHMSIVLRVAQDRSIMFATLPPEPAISEAAAGYLSSEDVQVGALKHMLNACKQPRGEFVAKSVRPIFVEDYLKKLLYTGRGERSTWVGLKARSLPWKGYVFFNSFIAVNKVPDVAILARCWAMGQAIMYSADNSLPGADIVIPVWTSQGMTAIVVSVKNVRRAGWRKFRSTR